MTIEEGEPGQLLDGRTANGPASASWTIDGRPYLNFAGSGYLALSRLPELRNAAYAALALGTAFSRQVSPAYGITDSTFDGVETAAATALGTEAAVYFASGYLIGPTLFAAHARPSDRVFVDAGCHFNLLDASRACCLPWHQFAHRDPSSLHTELRARLRPAERPLVVTDGTHPTTGRLAPLHEYAEVLAPFAGLMLVDDAHGFGVVGRRGRGAAEHLGVESVSATAATLSKAFCAQGAVLGGDAARIRPLQLMPPLRGSNSGSPLSAAVAEAALRYVEANPARRNRLADMVTVLRRRLRSLGLDIAESPAPIVSFRVGDRATMSRLQRRLFEQDVYVPISDYLGAGPDGILRCAVYADHTPQDLERLVDAVAESC